MVVELLPTKPAYKGKMPKSYILYSQTIYIVLHDALVADSL